jgi:hypothetical protein
MASIPHLYWVQHCGIHHQCVYELDSSFGDKGCVYVLPRAKDSSKADTDKKCHAVIWSIAGFAIVSIAVLACSSPNYNSGE